MKISSYPDVASQQGRLGVSCTSACPTVSEGCVASVPCFTRAGLPAFLSLSPLCLFCGSLLQIPLFSCFYQSISLIPAFIIPLLPPGLLRIQYRSYWTGSLFPPSLSKHLCSSPVLRNKGRNCFASQKARGVLFIWQLFLFSLALICSEYFLHKCSSPKLTIKLSGCVCVRETRREEGGSESNARVWQRAAALESC